MIYKEIPSEKSEGIIIYRSIDQFFHPVETARFVTML